MDDIGNSGDFAALRSLIFSIVIRRGREESYHLLTKGGKYVEKELVKSDVKCN